MPMKNPPHPGLTIRHDCIEALGLSVTQAARTEARAAKEAAKAEAATSAEQAPPATPAPDHAENANPYDAHIPMERPEPATQSAPAPEDQADNGEGDEISAGEDSAENSRAP